MRVSQRVHAWLCDRSGRPNSDRNSLTASAPPKATHRFDVLEGRPPLRTERVALHPCLRRGTRDGRFLGIVAMSRTGNELIPRAYAILEQVNRAGEDGRFPWRNAAGQPFRADALQIASDRSWRAQAATRPCPARAATSPQRPRQGLVRGVAVPGRPGGRSRAPSSSADPGIAFYPLFRSGSDRKSTEPRTRLHFDPSSAPIAFSLQVGLRADS